MGLSFAKKSMSSRLVTMSIAPFDIRSTEVFSGNSGMSPAFAIKTKADSIAFPKCAGKIRSTSSSKFAIASRLDQVKVDADMSGCVNVCKD